MQLKFVGNFLKQINKTNQKKSFQRSFNINNNNTIFQHQSNLFVGNFCNFKRFTLQLNNHFHQEQKRFISSTESSSSSPLFVFRNPKEMAAQQIEKPDPKKIDGKLIADQVVTELAEEVNHLKSQGVTPGLAVVLVGDRKDSHSYVKMKKASAEKLGFHFVLRTLPENATQEQVLREVQSLNADPLIHGLLVQLPLPAHIQEFAVLDAVGLDKDVDGFHPYNMGCLAMKGRDPYFVPSTPLGCIELLKRKGVELAGKHVVVVGRSNIVGVPVSLLCMHQNATVTICHSRTVDLPSEVRKADVIIAAAGRPEMIKKDWVKPGCVVIDVGINPVEDKTKKTGFRLVGDVAYQEVKEVASLITPVPGGVGPMTVAMLMKQTVSSAKRYAAKKKPADVQQLQKDSASLQLEMLQIESKLEALENQSKK